MNNRTVYAFALVTMAITSPTIAQSKVTPEDFAVHQNLISITPSKTIYIQEKDPRTIETKVNQLHEEQAKTGWTLFQINTYIKNEDVKGLFVTYRKTGVTE